MKKKFKVIATAVAAAGAIGSMGITAVAQDSREDLRNEGMSSFAQTDFSALCSSIESRRGVDAEAFFSGTLFDFETGACADNNVE